jgi:hypothetical protein
MRGGITAESLGQCKMDMPDGHYRVAGEYRVVLPDGLYAVPLSTGGEYRVIMVKTVDEPSPLFGKRCVFYPKVRGWQSFAFLNEDGSLQFYLKTRATYTQQQMDILQSAVTTILRNPQKAKVKSKKHIVAEILAERKADADIPDEGAKQLKCIDCGSEFILKSQEQKFYAKKRFPEPKRCRECRKKRKLHQEEEEKQIYETARQQEKVRELFVNKTTLGAVTA